MCDLSPEAWTAIATVVLAALTAVLGAIGFFQFRAFNAAERRATASDIDNRVSRQRELRAYVHVDSKFQVVMPAKNAEEFFKSPRVYSIKIVNHGKTPAHKLRCYGGAAVADFPLPKQQMLASKLTDPIQNFSLGPQAEIECVIELSKNEENMRRIDSIKRTKAVVYIYGFIEYEDVFSSEKKFTFFRFLHTFNEAGTLPAAGDFIQTKEMDDNDNYAT